MSSRRRPAGLAMLITGLAILAVALGATGARGAVSLGSATSFAVLANTTITNTGATTVSGDVGLYPGTAVTGFGTVTRNGALHVGNAVAQQAVVDAGTAYGSLQSRTPCKDLTGSVLGQTVGTAADPLLPGVYCFSSSAQLTGDLYLSGGGEYIFRIGSTLTTASGSHVILQSGADACNVFWAVGSSATLGTNSRIVGTIIANTSITANTGAVVDGRLFALTGAVTLDSNTVGGPTCQPATTTTAPGATTTTAPGVTTTTAPGATTTTAPGATTTTAPVATTTTAPGATTTTGPGATTTTVLGATTTTVPGATTTTGPGATTTTVPGATAPGSATTTTAPATTTTAPGAIAPGAIAPGAIAPGATTTPAQPAAMTTSPTGAAPAPPGVATALTPGSDQASPGALLPNAGAGLRTEDLAHTGHGFSGPLSVATVLIFLGALLLLGQRSGGAAALAPPQISRAGCTPTAVGRVEPTSAASANAVTAVERNHHGVRAATSAALGSQSEPSELMNSLERQLHEADARLAHLRATDWLGED